AYEERGEARKALDDYTTALLLAAAPPPYRAHLYECRSSCWRHLNHPDRAVADLEQAVTLDPQNSAAAAQLARMYVAGPVKVRAPEKALPLAERAAPATADPLHLQTLGWLYYR